MIDLAGKITQSAFGELVGISQPAVSDLLSRGVMLPNQSAREWLHSYCSHLREQAAGRAAAGDLDLATERAGLARAQRERIEMQNAVTRKQLAPVSLIEEVLANVGRQIAATLEAIPVQLKRRTTLSVAELEIVESEIVKARNLAADISLDQKEPEFEDEEVAEEEGEDEEIGGEF